MSEILSLHGVAYTWNFLGFCRLPNQKQPPVKWVPGLSWRKVLPGRAADNSSPSSAAVMEE